MPELFDTLGITFYEGYGLTETSGCVTTQRYSHAGAGSLGLPIAGTRIALELLPSASTDSQDGEIIVYGDGVMSGYWKDPHGSQRALTEDGGMRTGDVGRVDAHGRVHITGRLATDYKLDNGWRVAPIAVEETLLLSPFIAQVFVSGSARPYNVALVVPEDVALARWADARSLVCEAEASLHAPEVRQLLEAEVVSVHAPCFLITKGIDGRIRS